MRINRQRRVFIEGTEIISVFWVQTSVLGLHMEGGADFVEFPWELDYRSGDYLHS